MSEHPFTKYRAVLTVKWKLPKVDGAPPESKHVYTFCKQGGTPCKLKTSVTGLKGEFLPFDKIGVARKLELRYKYTQHRVYGGMSIPHILWIWYEKAVLGTLVHDASEEHSQGGTVPTSSSFKLSLRERRTGGFLQPGEIRDYYVKTFKGLPSKLRERLFLDERASELLTKFGQTLDYAKYMNRRGYSLYKYPIFGKVERKAVEVQVISEILKLGGTFDSLWVNKLGTRWVVSDWKCTDKKITQCCFRKKNLLGFLHDIHDYKDVFKDYRKLLRKPQFWMYSHFVEYAVQLSLYHHILKEIRDEMTFKYRCDEIHIVRLSSENKKFDLTTFKSDIFEERIEHARKLILKS